MKRQTLFAIVGAFLALGAPAGLLLLRVVIGADPSFSVVAAEVTSNLDIYLYVGLSTMIAFALFGAVTGRQADRLSTLSRIDFLTGLANRRAIEELARLEHARARRQESTLAFLILDVDGLKLINDRDGHRAGDAALQAVATVMKTSGRAGDLCARWGGDEFAILAPSMDEEQARALGERIRVGVQVRSTGITVSVGIATLHPRSSLGGAESLFMRADAALYRAKREGRNRVVVDADPRSNAA